MLGVPETDRDDWRRKGQGAHGRQWRRGAGATRDEARAASYRSRMSIATLQDATRKMAGRERKNEGDEGARASESARYGGLADRYHMSRTSTPPSRTHLCQGKRASRPISPTPPFAQLDLDLPSSHAQLEPRRVHISRLRR